MGDNLDTMTDQNLESAAVEALRAIHENEGGRLKQLLAEYPALTSWRDEAGANLLGATTSFANNTSDADRERIHHRAECAALLIDAGTPVDRSVWTNVIGTRAAGMLHVLWSKGVLPRILPILAAVGDLDLVRACFDESGALRPSARDGDQDDRATVNEAFMNACGFKHQAVAAFLLERCIALDPDLGRRIDEWRDRAAFIASSEGYTPTFENQGGPLSLWQTFVMRQLTDAIEANDLPAFESWLRNEPSLLGPSYLDMQLSLLERASWLGRRPFVAHFLDLEPAVLRHRPPPKTTAVIYALEYGRKDLIPLLTRIWPLPDDLPSAAATGDLDRVKRWFDAAGRPALGDPHNHHPVNDSEDTRHRHLGTEVQQILDVALAWACMNRQLDVAAFLLEHGANINTRWGTHEPASILHECAYRGNYEAVRFLIDHGIDMTICDYRHDSTAEGWARYGAGNEEMADFLAAAERERAQKSQ